MKGMEKLTTISEFIASPALEETIVTNCPEYREKFSKIIEKADVQESDTKDEQAIKKITSTLSWNWSAFLFSYLWLIYRRENLLGWGLLIVVWFFPYLASIPAFRQIKSAHVQIPNTSTLLLASCGLPQ